jgi:hypothetical protein
MTSKWELSTRERYPDAKAETAAVRRCVIEYGGKFNDAGAGAVEGRHDKTRPLSGATRYRNDLSDRCDVFATKRLAQSVNHLGVGCRSPDF